MNSLFRVIKKEIQLIPNNFWLFTAFIIAEIILIDLTISLLHHKSSINELRNAIFTPGWDSWKPMQLAYQRIMAGHSDDLYQKIFFEQQNKFQYPPSSLLLYSFFDLIHLPISSGSFHILNLLSLIFMGLQMVACGGIAIEMAKKLNWNVDNPAALRGLALLAGMVSLFFYPADRAGGLGQVQTWLNCWFVMACYCWLKDKKLLAGMLVGAICLFKPQFGLFLIWGLLRQQWQFLLGWSIIIVPGELASLVAFGFENNLGYLSILSYLSRHGESFAANQSVNGLLNRLLGDGVGVVNWQANAFPPYRPVVYIITLISSALFVLFSLFRYLKRAEVNITDFIIAGISFTIASPIAWEHHYGFLPAAFVVLGVRILSMPAARSQSNWMLMLATIYTFSAHYIPHELFPIQGVGSLVQSYLLFAVMVLLITLYCFRDAILDTNLPVTYSHEESSFLNRLSVRWQSLRTKHPPGN